LAVYTSSRNVPFASDAQYFEKQQLFMGPAFPAQKLGALSAQFVCTKMTLIKY
jgi:hypothetical protein